MALAERLGAWVTFLVKFAVGEKRGQGSKTNKRVLYYRKVRTSLSMKIAACRLEMPANCLPKCPEVWGEWSRAGLLPDGASSAELLYWAAGQSYRCGSFAFAALPFSFYPMALQSWALKRLLLSHRYSVLLLVFKISTWICCLFTTLSSNSITLVWSYLIPSGRVISYPIPFFSLFSVLIIHLISLACWLLIFSCARSCSCSGFSLYGPIFKSIPQKLISFM